MFEKLKNLWVFIAGFLALLVIIVISVINLFGGIAISKEKLIKPLAELNVKSIEVLNFKAKIGFGFTFIAKDFMIELEDFNIKIGEFSMKRGFFNESITELTLKDAEITIIAEEDETIQVSLNRLKSLLFGGKMQEKLIEKITAQNVSLNIIRRKSGTTQSIKNFTGEIIDMVDVLNVKGKFDFGVNNYEIEGFVRLEDGSFEVKIDGINLVFKLQMAENKGKVSFSINNITSFLNDITPNTININLGAFDGTKNSFYFESVLNFNDVRKSIEFSQSKVQIFGGKEEDILIENLSNNSYKITAVFPELNLTKEVTSQELKVNDSKVPLLQFSSFFPHIKVLLDVKVPKINLNNADKITNLNLNLSFAFGEITGETSFKIGEKLTFNLKGVMQNYENTFRKGLIKASIDGVGVDFSSFDYFINFIYKGNKSEDFKLKFNAIIAGEEAVFEDISFIGNEIEVKNSKFEFNLYLKERGYFADINIEKLNLENIKLTIPAALKQPNGDLFRILFDYLKFKDFSYIKINCKSCKLNEETYKIAFKANTINSKIELEELSVNGAKIGVFIGGILDIRNPQSNIANLNVEVTKWEDFEFDKFLNISSIIEKFEEIKIPSFDGFAGSIIFNGKSISNKFNKIEAMEVRLRMNAGILKENTSKIKINGVETENFINMEIIMRSARPEISASLNLPSVEVSGILAYILNRKEFTKINGFAGVGASFTTRGVLAKDLVQNISAIFEIKSNKIEINNFAIDEIARVLTNPLISFKSLTNTQIQNQMNNKGFYELSSKIAFSENTFNVENLDLKSQGSNSIFVGKLTLLPQNKYLLQMVGKTATAGADLNSNLNGLMPVYITSAISNKEEEIETKFDYSQVNKYSEARRVLYK